MLSTKDTEKRKQIQMISIEDLVPKDRFLRKIEAALDFSFIRDEVKHLYYIYVRAKLHVQNSTRMRS